MDIDSDIAIAVNWGSFERVKGSYSGFLYGVPG